MKRFLFYGFILISFSTFYTVGNLCIAEDKFPTKPITVLIGYSAGGPSDLPIRYLADGAGKRLGQPMVLINKEGGAGSMAIAELKHSKPDGYTIGVLVTGAVIGAHMKKLPYHPVNDFDPIIQHVAGTYGISVQASSPFKTLKDLITYARDNPGKVTYSTAGVGTPQHLVMMQLGEAAKVKWIHIPAGSGAKAALSLLGGHVTCTANLSESMPYISTGQVRPLVLFSEKRYEDTYPGVPALIELGYNFVALNLYCIIGPKGMPRDRLQLIHDTLYQGMQDPGYAAALKRIDLRVFHRNPEELRKYIEEVYNRSGEILKTIGKE